MSVDVLRWWPPEWWPHEATWISWPHNRETWPWQLAEVERAMAAVVHALIPFEEVHINVLDEDHGRHVLECLSLPQVWTGRVHIHLVPTDDAWIRDHGATVVFERTENTWSRVALNWGYNAWGGKYPPWEQDARVATAMASALEMPVEDVPVILEGGAIETNGEGLLLTTTSCLLNPNRNPGWTRETMSKLLQERLGVRTVYWLEGELEGDDTDGHIDQLVRFVDPHTLVVATERDPARRHYASLKELRRQVELLARHHQLEVIELPLPEPIQIEGQPMPASYANFYIANRTVLVPTFGDTRDAPTLELLQRLFPERHVVGIDCSEVIWGLGALHCLTQQIPALPG